MKTRIKKTLVEATVPSVETAEQVMGELALTQNNLRKLKVRIDAEKLAVDEKYEGEIAALTCSIDGMTDTLYEWAVHNTQMFVKTKSFDFPTGTAGFRTDTPKVVLLNSKWKWPMALEQVQKFLPNFIRNLPEIDKAALIGQRDEPIIQETLPKCGLKITQSEQFFVKPNLSDLDATVKQESA